MSDPSRTCDFTVTIPLEAGFLAPVNTILNKIKSFCYKEGLECKVFKSGFLVKNIEVIVKGHGTCQYANDVRDAFRRFTAQFY